MCSNFGINHHPGRKQALLERMWYDNAIRFYWWLRRKLFVREINRQGLR
jgi:hypothetical protein